MKMYLEIASGEKARREAAAKAEEEAALGSMGGGAAAGSDGSSGLSKSLYFGDLPDTMTALKIARKLVDAGEKVEAGIRNVVDNMRRRVGTPDIQIKCINILSQIAYEGNHCKTVMKSGMMKAIHHDYDMVSPISVALQKEAAVSAVLVALNKYTSNSRLVLRALWALEHICESVDNRRVFVLDGGKATLQKLDALYKGNSEIQKGIALLRKPVGKGTTTNCVVQ